MVDSCSDGAELSSSDDSDWDINSRTRVWEQRLSRKHGVDVSEINVNIGQDGCPSYLGGCNFQYQTG